MNKIYKLPFAIFERGIMKDVSDKIDELVEAVNNLQTREEERSQCNDCFDGYHANCECICRGLVGKGKHTEKGCFAQQSKQEPLSDKEIEEFCIGQLSKIGHPTYDKEPANWGYKNAMDDVLLTIKQLKK